MRTEAEYIDYTRRLLAESERASAIKAGENAAAKFESEDWDSEESPHLCRKGRWPGKKAALLAYDQMRKDAAYAYGMHPELYRMKFRPNDGEIVLKVRRKARAGA